MRSIVDDAISIWRHGVHSVTPAALFANKVHRSNDYLVIAERAEIDMRRTRRLIIVGAGKASAAMAIQFVERVKQLWPNDAPQMGGWINAPAGTFTQPLESIQLHAARPVGMNIPTEQAILGTLRMVQLVSTADYRDVVVCLISGGGSALLVAPQPGICLQDKQAVAECVAAAGGNIIQLNAIRRCLSQVKGGGLARACQAAQMVTLIISDVLGDSLEAIASGPTVLDSCTDHRQALQAIQDLQLTHHPRLSRVVKWLRNTEPQPVRQPKCSVENIVLGNLADAVDAAGVRAVELGYRYLMQTAREPEGDVAKVAEQAELTLKLMSENSTVNCWLSGGEPTVTLPDPCTGLGGRNQQLSLNVLALMQTSGLIDKLADQRFVFLSGGTDGEDGPTPAAGAWFDSQTLAQCQLHGLDPHDYLQRADAYHFFEQAGSLLLSGPTGTNVCDLRVALIEQNRP